MDRQYCSFHTSEDIAGTRLADGSYSFTCEESGHPGGGPWRWLEVPEPASGVAGISGLADELNLHIHLPTALASLGDGWFEYGLVERAYALRHPYDFDLMVQRWGHTALQKKQYTASAYIAGTLGRLAAHGDIAYRGGHGSGRWDYDSDISYWATDPSAAWDERTRWVDVFGDSTAEAKVDDAVCRGYVRAVSQGG